MATVDFKGDPEVMTALQKIVGDKIWTALPDGGHFDIKDDHVKLVNDGEVIGSIGFQKSSVLKAKPNNFYAKQLQKKFEAYIKPTSSLEAGPAGAGWFQTGPETTAAETVPTPDATAEKTIFMQLGDAYDEAKFKDLMALPPVPLATVATTGEVMHPVHGTSQGSVYHCVSVSHGHKVAVAVRIKNGNQMSVRVEGDGLSLVANVLTELGFDGNPASHYSVHLSNITKMEAMATLGATTCAMSSVATMTPVNFNWFDMLNGKGK